MKMNQDQIDSLVRTLLKYGGGLLSAHGLAGLGNAINTPAAAQVIGGIVVAIIGAWASHKSNADPLAPTTAVPEAGAPRPPKIPAPVTTIVGLLLLLALPATAQTNNAFFSAKECVGEIGPAVSVANVLSRRTTGARIGLAYWQTYHTGTEIAAGVEDVRSPNPLIFDYTEIGESYRLPWWRLAPAGSVFIGTEYLDGSKYTKPELSCEFRFTQRLGFKLAVNDKLSTSSRTGGPGGYGVVTWNF